MGVEPSGVRQLCKTKKVESVLSSLLSIYKMKKIKHHLNVSSFSFSQILDSLLSSHSSLEAVRLVFTKCGNILHFLYDEL